jgi:hypothetical protein
MQISSLTSTNTSDYRSAASYLNLPRDFVSSSKPCTQLFINNIPNHRTLTIQVQSSYTIKVVKNKIRDKLGAADAEFTLSYGNRNLKVSTATLYGYDIAHDSTLCCLSFRGSGYIQRAEAGKNRIGSVVISSRLHGLTLTLPESLELNTEKDVSASAIEMIYALKHGCPPKSFDLYHFGELVLSDSLMLKSNFTEKDGQYHLQAVCQVHRHNLIGTSDSYLDAFEYGSGYIRFYASMWVDDYATTQDRANTLLLHIPEYQRRRDLYIPPEQYRTDLLSMDPSDVSVRGLGWRKPPEGHSSNPAAANFPKPVSKKRKPPQNHVTKSPWWKLGKSRGSQPRLNTLQTVKEDTNYSSDKWEGERPGVGDINYSPGEWEHLSPSLVWKWRDFVRLFDLSLDTEERAELAMRIDRFPNSTWMYVQSSPVALWRRVPDPDFSLFGGREGQSAVEEISILELLEKTE